jgi:hypothetical protein
MDKKCPTKILDDLPVSEDKFGSHSRIAKALAELINGEKGGKSIALKGRWGSGKSSIIEMLSGELNSDIHIFNFNAWIHEGDPLKRIFLEKLIDFFIQNNLIKEDEKWEKIKASLNAKKFTEKTEKKSFLTGKGKIFALASLLLPVGIGLMSIVDINNLSRIFYFGLVLSASPFLLLLMFWGYNQLFSDENEDPFNFLSNEDDVTINKTSIERPEPSSIKFQKLFSDLLDEGLNDNKKLIIVMDNLDRINAKDALKMWSTMRIFFDLPIKKHLEEKFWLVVPYDEESIKDLWDSEDNGIGKSFLEKTFQVEFTVSPPVLSDWRQYFVDNLKVALPEHNKSEFHDLYKICQLIKESKDNNVITPREIKNIINKIAAFHLQWQDEIKLNHITLYIALQKYTDVNIEKDLIKINFINELSSLKLNNYFDENWRKELAALHLNLPEEKAMEIILKPRLDSIIKKNNFELLDNIEITTGVLLFLENYLEDLLMNSENHCENIILFSQKFSSFHISDNNLKNKIRRMIIKYIGKNDEIKNLNLEIASGLIKISKWENDNSFDKLILKLVSNTVYYEDEKNKKMDDIDKWLLSVKEIIDFILENRDQNFISENLIFKMEAEDYLSIIERLGEKNDYKYLYQFFKSNIPLKKIMDKITDNLNTGNQFKNYKNIIKILEKIYTEFDEKVILNYINSNLRNANQTYTSDQFKIMLETLLSYSEKNTFLDNLIKQGFLFYHYDRTNTNNKNSLALLLYAVVKCNPEFKFSFSNNVKNQASKIHKSLNNIIIKPNSNKEIIEEFLRYYVKEYDFKDLINLYNQYNNLQKLINYIFEILIENNTQYIDNETLILNWNKLAGSLSLELKNKLINKKIMQSNKLIDIIISTKFELKLSGLYLLIIDNIDDLQNNFSKFLKKSMRRKVTKEMWLNSLKKENGLLDLLVKLNQKNINLALGSSLSDALLEHAKSLLNKEINLPNDINKWNLILRSLNQSSLEILSKRLLQDILNSNNDIEEVIKLFGDEMLKWNIISDKIGNLFIYFKNILDRQNDVELNWLIKLFEKNQDNIITIINEGNYKSEVSDFMDRSERLIKDYRNNKEEFNFDRDIINKLDKINELLEDEQLVF